MHINNEIILTTPFHSWWSRFLYIQKHFLPKMPLYFSFCCLHLTLPFCLLPSLLLWWMSNVSIGYTWDCMYGMFFGVHKQENMFFTDFRKFPYNMKLFPFPVSSSFLPTSFRVIQVWVLRCIQRYNKQLLPIILSV